MIYKDDELTDWSQLGEVPQHVGEYNVSMYKIENLLRWWNGLYWSVPYLSNMPLEDILARRNNPAKDRKQSDIYFRGLKVKP